MEHTASFGYWLRRRRKALDLTQNALAQQAGCALGTLKKIESDARRPSRQLAERLATCLAIPAADRAAFVQAARAELAIDRLSLIAQPIEHDPTKGCSILNNLPAQPTALIGREREIAHVIDLLHHDDARLLTLTGPGGAGKTRLALQAAADLLAAFADGVWFVNLAPIRDPALVLPTIAQTLGIIEMSGQPVEEQLQAYLRTRHLLLLLDNFEQVIEAAPRVAELLATAPRLKVLVTSRAILHIYGEHEYAVPPLTLPPVGSQQPTTDDQITNSLDVITLYESVRLFIVRARAAKADFAVSNINAPAVAEICHRLDGLPLAIELAAARIKLFEPEALLSRLSQPLALLVGGPRDLPARHQTLRNTIEWSYNLLEEAEQALFRRLGVFVGGCTMEAAEAVCMGDVDALPTPASDSSTPILNRLASLLDKSLLRHETGSNGESRFMMLETLREYALELLEETGEKEAIRRRHAEYFVVLAELAEPHLRETPVNVWWQQIAADYDNLRAIFAECQTSVINAEIGLRLGRALWQFWIRSSRHREGYTWLTAALEHDNTAAARIRAKAMIVAGQLAQILGKQPATTLLETALTLSRKVKDKQGTAQALAELGRVARLQGNYARAVRLEEESLALFREIGDGPNMIGAVLGLGDAALDQGDVIQATQWFQEALTFNDQFSSNWAMIMLARVAYVQGNNKQGWVILQKCITISRSIGDFIALAATLIELGRVARLSNDVARAFTYFRESLMLLQHRGSGEHIANALEGLAGVAVASGHPERAAYLFSTADVVRITADIPLSPVMRAKYEQDLAAIHTQIEDATFAAAWAQGQALTPDEAIAEALRASPM